MVPHQAGRQVGIFLREFTLYCKVLAMTIPSASTPPMGRARNQDVSEPETRDGRLNRTLVGHALLAGIAGDALLHHPAAGIAFPVWIAIVALTLVSLVWRSGRAVSSEAGGWLVVATLAACGVAWRDSETLQIVDVLATLGALGMAAVALSGANGALFATRLRDTLWHLVAIARTTVAGILPLALRELFAEGGRGRWAHSARPAIRATLIAASLLFVFGSLLRDADPIFASLVSLPAFDIGSFISHLVVAGFYTWVVGGWFRSTLADGADVRRAPDQLPFALGMLDVTTALGTLNVLFATFVVTQMGWFFGGEQFLRARTGLTAAEYARDGFFQMMWVVLLVVPVLLVTRAALQPGRELARRHTALALPVVGLLGAIILSAVLRMKLYVHYYGLTTERFYPLVLMGWLAVVLVWLALTVLRGDGRSFVAGALITGYATLFALNVVAPDAIVARVNLERAARGAELDLSHLASLSGEASELATGALLASTPTKPGLAARYAFERDRCDAATRLLKRWGPSSEVADRVTRDGAWRFWNAGEARAVRVVRGRARELAVIRQQACFAYKQATPRPYR
jgi:hypothetical protein